ncbi:hypothetical protein HZC27_00250 [Candidatus Roizmanbacteria bacterium]|nr:hypothetical protein [Candidatus Roizmanbacteria bacterium]
MDKLHFSPQIVERVLGERTFPIPLEGGRQIVGVEQLGIPESARRMSEKLHKVYGVHNLSRDVSQIQGEIERGVLEPIFIIHEGETVAQAAFVKGPKTIELGRTAGAGGGLLMRKLAQIWQDDPDENRVLVAETRMAAPWEGIDGGQGSQATLLNPEKVGMIPHAFMPTFQHPGPNGPMRQEMFGFLFKEKAGCESKRVAPEFIHLSDRPEMNRKLIQLLIGVNGFGTEICKGRRSTWAQHKNFELTQQAGIPFNVLVLSPIGGVKFIPHESSSPFDLVELSTFDRDLSVQADFLVNNGFFCCGISPPHDGKLKLLFGRLRKTEFAPTQVMDGMPFIRPELILQVHNQFAQKMQQL